jgi:hypothetical protein
MTETIDKAWINLWLPELNEPQVKLLLAQIEAGNRALLDDVEGALPNPDKVDKYDRADLLDVLDDVATTIKQLKDKGSNQ